MCGVGVRQLLNPFWVLARKVAKLKYVNSNCFIQNPYGPMDKAPVCGAGAGEQELGSRRFRVRVPVGTFLFVCVSFFLLVTNKNETVPCFDLGTFTL
jgi:hypothetical protein